MQAVYHGFGVKISPDSLWDPSKRLLRDAIQRVSIHADFKVRKPAPGTPGIRGLVCVPSHAVKDYSLLFASAVLSLKRLLNLCNSQTIVPAAQVLLQL